MEASIDEATMWMSTKKTPVSVSFLPHPRLLAVTAFHVLLGSSTFYHQTSLKMLQVFVKEFINSSYEYHRGYAPTAGVADGIWLLMSIALALGAVLGALTIVYPVERWGSRHTVMVFKNVLHVASCLLMFFAVTPLRSFEVLIVGRVLCGVSIVYAMYIPVFVAECAPVAHRGLTAALAYMGNPLWRLFGTIGSLPIFLGRSDCWHYSFLVSILPSVVHMVCTWRVPNSPKHVYIQKPSETPTAEEQLAVLHFYHGEDVDVDEVMEEYHQERGLSRFRLSSRDASDVWASSMFERSRSVNSNIAVQAPDMTPSDWTDIGALPHLLWPSVLCVVAGVAAKIAGVTRKVHVHYWKGFMEVLGIQEELASISTIFALQLPAIAIMLIALAFIEQVGRRRLMIGGILASIAATTCLFVARYLEEYGAGQGYRQSREEGQLTPSQIVGVLGLLLAAAGNSVPSMVAALLPSELCPQQSRARVASLTLAFNWLPTLLIIGGYPALRQLAGPFAILPLTAVGVMTFLFLSLFLPETSGRTVAEVVMRWRRRPPLTFYATESQEDLLSTSGSSLSDYGSI